MLTTQIFDLPEGKKKEKEQNWMSFFIANCKLKERKKLERIFECDSQSAVVEFIEVKDFELI